MKFCVSAFRVYVSEHATDTYPVFWKRFSPTVQMNVLVIRKMLQLARRMTRLQVFVHVSTAYANCDRDVIEEVVYPSSVEPQRVIDIVEYVI